MAFFPWAWLWLPCFESLQQGHASRPKATSRQSWRHKYSLVSFPVAFIQRLRGPSCPIKALSHVNISWTPLAPAMRGHKYIKYPLIDLCYQHSLKSRFSLDRAWSQDVNRSEFKFSHLDSLWRRRSSRREICKRITSQLNISLIVISEFLAEAERVVWSDGNQHVYT